MKLAINVATKCKIEAEPVWSTWGMSLLRMGKYTEAKEKFNYCLIPSVSTESRHSSGARTSSSTLENQKLLNEIIQVLTTKCNLTN